MRVLSTRHSWLMQRQLPMQQALPHLGRCRGYARCGRPGSVRCRWKHVAGSQTLYPVGHAASLGVTVRSNVSLAVSGQALIPVNSTHAMVGIAVNRAAKGVKPATGTMGVGSAQSAQTARTAVESAAVTVGATGASIGTVVASGVIASMTEPLIMAGSVAA